MKRLIAVIIATTLSIIPLVSLRAQRTPYLRVASVNVNLNEIDTLSSDYITGLVYYTPQTNTLTLNNANVQGGIYSAIQSMYMDLTIEIIGENNIEHYYGLVMCKKNGVCKFKGEGTLTISGDQSALIAEELDSVIVEEGCTLNLNATFGCALYTYPFTPVELKVSNSTLTVNGGVRNVGGLSLIDCYLATEYASYSSEMMSVVDAENNYCNEFTIKPGHVGITDVECADYRIWGSRQGAHIENAKIGVPVYVYNYMGQLFYHGVVTKDEEIIPIKKGLWIVRVGKQSTKVVVP